MPTNKSTVTMLASGFLASAFLLACAPEPLLGANNDETDATTEPDVNLADTDPGTDNNPPGANLTFTAVADIIRGNCAIGVCHGSAGVGGDFFVEGAHVASDAQVRAALEGKNALDGTPYIVPNAPASSYLYIAITSDEAEVVMPPAPMPVLNADQIAIIEGWINDGAPY